MALKFYDGLGLYKNASEASLANPALWVYSFTTNGGRFGGACAYAFNANAFMTLSAPTPQDGVCFFGASVCFNAVSAAYFLVFQGSGGSWLGKIGVSNAGHLTVYGQTAASTTGTVVARTDKPVLAVGRWYRLEIKFVPGSTDANGAIAIHLNGEEVLNVTGIDTHNGSETLEMISGYGLYNSQDTWRIDDIMVWDASGDQNNDWLGDLRIDELLPTANGEDQDWTPNTGSAYAAVDDALVSADDDTTYISSSTVGSNASFAMGNLANASQKIMAVKTRARMKNTDAGARTIKTYMRSGIADAADAADQTPGTVYAVLHGDIHELNPEGDVAWTDSAVNAIEAGVSIAS